MPQQQQHSCLEYVKMLHAEHAGMHLSNSKWGTMGKHHLHNNNNNNKNTTSTTRTTTTATTTVTTTCKGGITEIVSSLSQSLPVHGDTDIKQDSVNYVLKSPWNEQSGNITRFTRIHNRPYEENGPYEAASSNAQSLQVDAVSKQESDFYTEESTGNKVSRLHSSLTPFVVNIKQEEDSW